MWTEFYDLHSGGYPKLGWSRIYIELPRKSAIREFKERFHIDPKNVTCCCCGDDYVIFEQEEAPEERDWVLIIRKSEIKR